MRANAQSLPATSRRAVWWYDTMTGLVDLLLIFGPCGVYFLVFDRESIDAASTPVEWRFTIPMLTFLGSSVWFVTPACRRANSYHSF